MAGMDNQPEAVDLPKAEHEHRGNDASKQCGSDRRLGDQVTESNGGGDGSDDGKAHRCDKSAEGDVHLDEIVSRRRPRLKDGRRVGAGLGDGAG